MVLLAGKGHENYQILADRTFELMIVKWRVALCAHVVLMGRKAQRGMAANRKASRRAAQGLALSALVS